MRPDFLAKLARLITPVRLPNSGPENVAAAMRTMSSDVRRRPTGDQQARLIGDRGNTQSL